MEDTTTNTQQELAEEKCIVLADKKQEDGRPTPLVELRPLFTKLIPQPNDLEYGTLYISTEYGTAAHLCPCGCNTEVVTPLFPPHGWQITQDNEGRLSLNPSLLNSACKSTARSHYFIIENQIKWC